MMSIDFDFIEHNIGYLAQIANGQFIDPLVRPKKDRKMWTATAYEQQCLDAITWWRKQPEDVQLKHLNGVREFVFQALQGEFPVQRVRWIYGVLAARPDTKIVQEDREKKQRLHTIRDAQADMDPLDVNYKCLLCGKFAHERDATNNKRHEKAEVCTCGGVKGPQQEMRDLISQYRKDLKEKRQLAKEKEGRVPQRR